MTMLGLQIFRYFRADEPIQWPGQGPPITEPPCGFVGEKCSDLSQPDWRSFVICTVSGIVLIVAIGLVSRRYRYERKLACQLWKVDIRDVVITCSDLNEVGSPAVPFSNVVSQRELLMTFAGGNNNNSSDSLGPPVDASSTDNITGSGEFQSVADVSMTRAYTRVGRYKGNAVAIKAFSAKNVDLTRNIRKELKQV